MAKILLSAGPIPARLDSVKFITNRFKGGLALKTGEMLKELGHDVTIVKWKHTDLRTKLPCHDVEDIFDYRGKILGHNADVYILTAAVANLIPTNPWKGKFPSHDYCVGDEFDIKFTIAPRIIDEVKKIHPRSTLIGYKLFDGKYEELIAAGRETLFNSKANVVFANTPDNAKTLKYMLTQDGAVIPCSFDRHVELIDELANAEFFKTKIVNVTQPPMPDYVEDILQTYPRTKIEGRTYGCFAVKNPGGWTFWTTTRGKRERGLAYVSYVDYVDLIVETNRKATFNVPLLAQLFYTNPKINIIIHNHRKIPSAHSFDYEFPGTRNEVDLHFPYGENVFNINHHGYVAGFRTFEEYKEWINKHET
jgi:hypothetical protein